MGSSGSGRLGCSASPREWQLRPHARPATR
jgi:hypothetical protein